jgi:uncharacterized protein YhdP
MTPKVARLADSDKGAAELEVLMTALHGQDWVPEGNGWNLSDDEHRAMEARQLEQLYSEIEAEHAKHRQAFITLQKVKRILRDFRLRSAREGLTLSAMQPVLELCDDLNPGLQDELLPEPNPFI